jgi:hypothetical protein
VMSCAPPCSAHRICPCKRSQIPLRAPRVARMLAARKIGIHEVVEVYLSSLIHLAGGVVS